MGCDCLFCRETNTALKRMKEYLKPEDYQAVENAIEENIVHHSDLEFERNMRILAEARIKDLEKQINENAHKSP